MEVALIIQDSKEVLRGIESGWKKVTRSAGGCFHATWGSGFEHPRSLWFSFTLTLGYLPSSFPGTV